MHEINWMACRAVAMSLDFLHEIYSNHPVRLRFATARHPSTLEGNFIRRDPGVSRSHWLRFARRVGPNGSPRDDL
ncbi:MAG: hypothetical protein LBB23_00060 [Rickettsiales bacterium]|nr:hypothetical protein [Rickettsiales bacterium]